MYRRRTVIILALVLATEAVTPALAVDWRCAFDRDGNGEVGGIGETAVCTVTAQGPLCPLQAAACETDTGTPVCPLGDQYACLPEGEGFRCSSAPCIDLEVSPPITTTVNPGAQTNNGEIDPEGQCTQEIAIFPGEGSRCRLGGLLTTGANCCANKGEVIKDSIGTISDTVTAVRTLKQVYGIAQIAYAGYVGGAGGLAGGATGVAGASAAVGEYIAIAFNPAAIVVAVIIILVTEFLLQGCDETDTQVALANGSGFCYLVEEYCDTEWSLLGCVQKARSYCCFNSKLARIIHQYGRPQLISFGEPLWGDAENPNCRGFTPEEFQALDFSRIDLSEYYEDLKHEAAELVQDQVEQGVEKFYEQTR